MQQPNKEAQVILAVDSTPDFNFSTLPTGTQGIEICQYFFVGEPATSKIRNFFKLIN
jgi:hypothetical protein